MAIFSVSDSVRNIIVQVAMESLLKKLYWLDSQMGVIEEFMKNMDSEDLKTIEMKTFAYNKYWEAYDEIVEKIEGVKNNSAKALSREYLESENYEALVEAMKELGLRKKNLSKYSGKIEDWPGFRNLFDRKINKCTDLSLAEKLECLTASVEGVTSAELLKGTPEEYSEVWNRVKNYYDNLLEEKLRSDVD